MEFSQFDPNSTVAYMVYGVGMATVAVDRLASAISKWSHRRDGKSIEFFEDGQIKVITGFSQDQARALIDEAITRQCNVDRQWQEHAMRHPRPARPPRPEDTPPEP